MDNVDYEIIFTGAGDKVEKDADAICLRYKSGTDASGNDEYKTLVYDCGFEANANAAQDFMNGHFFAGGKARKIDYVVASHMDADHISGLKLILENYEVGALYANLPWNYTDELYDKINDARITKESLAERLKSSYSNLDDLEKVAKKQKIEIKETFAGELIGDKIRVLSPSKDFFLENIATSAKNEFLESKEEPTANALEKLLLGVKETIRKVKAFWEEENLREAVETSAENETSVILFGEMGTDRNFLLTGDAGVKALNAATKQAEKMGIILAESVSFYQIPHHGSKHNVSPSVLDSIVGPKVAKGTIGRKTAFVSTAKGSDHPRKIVLNGFITRGVKAFNSNGAHLRHHVGSMPNIEGWGTATPEEFSDEVEAWEN